MKKKHTVDLSLKSRHGGSTMQRVDAILQRSKCAIGQSLAQVLGDKEEVARAEVEAFVEHCAKRWQTKRALTSSSDSCLM